MNDQKYEYYKLQVLYRISHNNTVEFWNSTDWHPTTTDWHSTTSDVALIRFIRSHGKKLDEIETKLELL